MAVTIRILLVLGSLTLAASCDSGTGDTAGDADGGPSAIGGGDSASPDSASDGFDVADKPDSSAESDASAPDDGQSQDVWDGAEPVDAWAPPGDAEADTEADTAVDAAVDGASDAEADGETEADTDDDTIGDAEADTALEPCPNGCDDADPCTVDECTPAGCTNEASGACARGCGDGECALAEGETCLTCEADCGYCPAPGQCCNAKAAPGCPDAAATEACVCGLDPFCCSGSWDEVCVELLEPACGQTCDYEPECGDGTCALDYGENCADCEADCGACGGDSSCCDLTGKVGCEDPVVQECVCAERPYCCAVAWDAGCVALAAHACGASCQSCGDLVCTPAESCLSCSADCGSCEAPDPVCGNGQCGAGESCALCPDDCGNCGAEDCCGVTSGGCSNSPCEALVCAVDDTCCSALWDEFCVSLATASCGCEPNGGCGDGVCSAGESCAKCLYDCGPCAPKSNCCVAHGPPGCDDAECQSAICSADSFCCDTSWDDICTGAALANCAACAGTADTCGDEICMAFEDCTSCEADCGACAPKFCGDAICQTDSGESFESCPQDCGELCSALSANDCCAPKGTPGCSVAACVELICPPDPFCCDNSWDDICTGAAKEKCAVCIDPPAAAVCGDGTCEALECESCASCSADCGACGGCGDGACTEPETCESCGEDCGACASPSCCEGKDGAGCAADLACEAAVCALDPYCCNTAWDGACGSCAAGGPGYDGLDCTSVIGICVCE